MSLSLGEENFSSLDNELNDQDVDYVSYLTPELYPEEESGTISVSSFFAKWRKTPRSPADFSESKSSTTLCKDSEYEDWLQSYYQGLIQNQTAELFNDKEVDTSDLVKEQNESNLDSYFVKKKKNLSSDGTKYWNPNDVRRHWPLCRNKGEYLFFPSIHPHLNLKSRYGRYHSLLNSAAAVPESNHKLVCSLFKKNLESLGVNESQLSKLMYCDSLCNLKWFDFLTKSTVVKCLCRFLRIQYRLEKVYFENMNLEKLEGVILLCALSRNAGDRIKELHIWKMFGYGQCPLLDNEISKKVGSNKRNKEAKSLLRIHYLQILYNFSTLTHLSINYSYLANKKGNALLCLKCIRVGCLRELRILCLKSERPFLTNPGYGVGGWSITDGVWKRATEWCPEMRVKFVFLNMPQYENVITFMSKSIPVSYVYLSSGIDLSCEVPWDIDSTLLELRNWYSVTLETLCLHLWRHRDLLDFIIKAKILNEFPNLKIFEFIGVLEDIETLEAFCCQLSSGNYIQKDVVEKNLLTILREIMEGKHLIVSVSSMPPYVHYIIENDAIILQGCFGQLWNVLEERLGFSSQYMVESYNIGVMNFRNKRRDVLLRPSVISSDDVEKFDFTYPVGNTWYELYIKDSDEINTSKSYVRNLSPNIWICTSLLIFIFIFILYTVLYVSHKFFLKDDIKIVPTHESTFRLVQYFSQENNDFFLPKDWRKLKKIHWKLKNQNERSLGNCFLATIGIFSAQGVYLPTSTISVRILVFSFLLFSMIIYNAYSALLVSQLTLGEQFLPFDTLEEIPEKGQKYSLCVRPESYPFMYFTVNSSKTVIRNVWKNIINRPPCMETEHIPTVLCEPYVAFLETPPVMNEYFLKFGNCKTTNLRGKYFKVDFSFMLIKGFEERAKRELNKEILKYHEVGILSYLRKRWIRNEENSQGTGNERLQVTFEHIDGVLMVYIFCIGFSCSVFFIEIGVYLCISRQLYKLQNLFL